MASDLPSPRMLIRYMTVTREPSMIRGGSVAKLSWDRNPRPVSQVTTATPSKQRVRMASLDVFMVVSVSEANMVGPVRVRTDGTSVYRPSVYFSLSRAQMGCHPSQGAKTVDRKSVV